MGIILILFTDQKAEEIIMAKKFLSLLKAKNEKPLECPPVTIGFLGDSVTNGCFEVLPANTDHGTDGYDVVFDQEHSYSSYLYRTFISLYPNAQINIVNAGISGDDAPTGLSRMDRDLMSFHPDLVIVCYGLNDAYNGPDKLDTYKNALTGILRRILASGAEAILMTPQPVCTRVHGRLDSAELRKLAVELAELFHSGVFDRYMNAAREAAAEAGVPVCDCYAKWMRMYESGVDITDHLVNYLNHPTRQMHWLFANSLADTIFMND